MGAHMGRSAKGRDHDAIEDMLATQDAATADKIRAYLVKSGAAEQDDIRALIELLQTSGISSAAFTKRTTPQVKPCANMVCDMMACVSSSSCQNGACSEIACSARTGGILPPSDPVQCKNAATCGTSACHQNAGATHCSQEICSSLVS